MTAALEELRRRMGRPQRHRLLQGYPMAPAMWPATPDFAPQAVVEADPRRPLIVGVLPHPFCNPSVQGCGFCTFPHQRFAAAPLRDVVAQVCSEIEWTGPRFAGRRVDALYFGGGTANLTPPAEFEQLCRALTRAFDLNEAEVTLEGVPVYFLARGAALLRLLREALPARQPRVSMGVQTFDPAWLARMGRTAFGDRETMGEVVRRAHDAGITTSADLLCNLPGQAPAAMLEDIAIADDLGFDQICVYHLVLYPGLGTPWSQDGTILAALPNAARALESWLAVRQALLDRGFVQTTLTNFERRDVNQGPRRFRYEECSFRPDLYDAAGFGPAAISCLTDGDRSRAVKWMNAAGAADYSRAIALRGSAVECWFGYEATDLRLLHLTRGLARTAIDRRSYREFFGTDALQDFPAELGAALSENLLALEGDDLRMTPRGMFFADSVTGLLANARLDQLNESAAHHMG